MIRVREEETVEDTEIKKLVQEQFGAAAQGYVTSATHARGGDLRRLIELARPRGDERLLDVATGGGHTALAFAPHVREVVASDLTPRMLEAAEAFIRGQGVTNVSFELADAEALPFEDASFDIVTSRIAPHHFPNPQRFVQEAARVLRPGGLFLLDDNMAPEDPELDAFMNRFEKWRDPSHVRACTAGQWRGWMEQAGLRVEQADPLASKRYDFHDWVARVNAPESEQAALEAWLIAAPPRCAECFEIAAEDGRVRSIAGKFAIIAARKG
jgi:ubiquinone/menaquinone biosynthesis C-methylase UbiE